MLLKLSTEDLAGNFGDSRDCPTARRLKREFPGLYISAIFREVWIYDSWYPLHNGLRENILTMQAGDAFPVVEIDISDRKIRELKKKSKESLKNRV